MHAATSALMSHEYKGSTVLAGAIVEVLLLWGLDRVGEVNVRTAYAGAKKGALDTWTLGD